MNLLDMLNPDVAIMIGLALFGLVFLGALIGAGLGDTKTMKMTPVPPKDKP